ncbi:hypothetical protein BGAL_0634g00020 [Botrytis galanthina]|uniref:Rhamnogalacturonase A/B/Epimerase-like pectate lyase domain-containing protein n=1 Tax=Botrytis galanthina TaxID=278940 RepID=A0A4S8QLX1_9HELO|nr:hypothetical protein BGAL_0634g00020 [Botrytis galanthina]
MVFSLFFLKFLACLFFLDSVSAGSSGGQGDSDASPYSHSRSCSYWLEDIKHQGIAAFNPNPREFQVFRNVKDFGAKGDGSTDDTAAINVAISRPVTFGLKMLHVPADNSKKAQALVYFPAGTYMVNSSIIQKYGVSLHGNPNCLPVIKALPTFQNAPGAIGLIDGNLSVSTFTKKLRAWVNVLRNFVIDTTLVPPSVNVTGINWPSAQATSLHNIVVNMPTVEGDQHIGLMGGGGEVFYSDLVFNGGHDGFIIPSGQSNLRNVTFNGCVIGLNLQTSTTVTAQGVAFNGCSTGIQTFVATRAVPLIDSSLKNVQIGIASERGDPLFQSSAAGSLILEDVEYQNVTILVQLVGKDSVLAGGTGTIVGWGQGNKLQDNIASNFSGSLNPTKRPSGLLQPGSQKWFSHAKPGYESLALKSFISARSAGARGDGLTDDTAALQAAIFVAVAQSKVLFLDHGSYKVTRTLYIPGNPKIVGEAFPNIFAAGEYFKSLDHPQPLLQVGKPGERGATELVDFVLGTQGGTAGAILIQHNLESFTSGIGGYWDVHTRIGGWEGSELQVAQCPTTPGVKKPPVDANCMAAFISMHITKSANGAYLENCWHWAADHDIDDRNLGQVQIFTRRGILVESAAGNNWLINTPSEHHSKYQYNFANTKNIFMSMAQSEEPYYQPNPVASYPYPYKKQLSDPIFSGPLNGTDGASRQLAWAQIMTNSHDVVVYGSSYFTYFDDWSTDCTTSSTCAEVLYNIDTKCTGITVYGFTTDATQYLVNRGGVNLAPSAKILLFSYFSQIAFFKQE